jgi:hypothetical protein
MCAIAGFIGVLGKWMHFDRCPFVHRKRLKSRVQCRGIFRLPETPIRAPSGYAPQSYEATVFEQLSRPLGLSLHPGRQLGVGRYRRYRDLKMYKPFHGLDRIEPQSTAAVHPAHRQGPCHPSNVGLGVVASHFVLVVRWAGPCQCAGCSAGAANRFASRQDDRANKKDPAKNEEGLPYVAVLLVVSVGLTGFDAPAEPPENRAVLRPCMNWRARFSGLLSGGPRASSRPDRATNNKKDRWLKGPLVN